MQNYFEILELPSAFALDLAMLEKNYFAQQRLFHPDRLVGKSPAERSAAVQRSMQVNEAFETLKNPLTRARHLLALEGIEVGGERDTVKPDHELLTEIMEFREAIAEVESSGALRTLRDRLEQERGATIATLSANFAGGDLQAAARQVIRLGYLMKMQSDIRVAEKRFT